MKLLKSEVELFNPGLTLALNLMWLIKKENRVLKKHSLIILTIKLLKDVKMVINQGLYIAGDHVIIIEWSNNKPTN